jgi:hypothetical protein
MLHAYTHAHTTHAPSARPPEILFLLAISHVSPRLCPAFHRPRPRPFLPTSEPGSRCHLYDQETDGRWFLVCRVQIIYLRATGGEVGASSALAPKIGPLGLVSLPPLNSNDHLNKPLTPSLRSVPSLLLLFRSRPRRSVKTSPRPPVTGRVSESPSS